MLKLHVLASIALMAALAAPVGLRAQDQDHDRDRGQQTDRNHDRDRARMPQSDRDEQGRIYDPYRRDYHDWNTNEQQYYSRWARQHRYQNRDYTQLNQKQQREYWKWRHQHATDRDHDNDRH